MPPRYGNGVGAVRRHGPTSAPHRLTPSGTPRRQFAPFAPRSGAEMWSYCYAATLPRPETGVVSNGLFTGQILRRFKDG